MRGGYLHSYVVSHTLGIRKTTQIDIGRLNLSAHLMRGHFSAVGLLAACICLLAVTCLLYHTTRHHNT